MRLYSRERCYSHHQVKTKCVFECLMVLKHYAETLEFKCVKKKKALVVLLLFVHFAIIFLAATKENETLKVFVIYFEEALDL